MRAIRFLWDNAAKLASLFFLLYLAIALIDFAIVLWRTHQCPLEDEISQLPTPYVKVIRLARSNDPAEIAAAAEMLYQDNLYPDASTELGFRNLCLAEDLRRVAASTGDKVSKQWLIDFYRYPNFPMGGRQRHTNPCKAVEWANFKAGDVAVPQKSFSLTRYFYANSCDIAHLWDGDDRVTLEAAISCVIRHRI